MSSISIRKKIESETIFLPELKPLIGKTVEIIVREELDSEAGNGDWDAAFQAVQELEGYDFEAQRQQRAFDKNHFAAAPHILD